MARKKSAKGQESSPAKTSPLYQFKITLLGTKPSVWRRIQVHEGTLDDLHAHIQNAMGWTNSHLHQFEINGETYGDPDLLDDGYDDFDCVDSTRTKLSKVIPKDANQLRFRYEYDFGDSWDHEILFEGRVPPDVDKKYPQCVDGERACPPEDIGGVWGYVEFLKAIRDPKHERHAEFLEWCGPFDPDAFDPAEATKLMWAGLPSWIED